MGKGKFIWEMLKAYAKNLANLTGARWVSPRDSIDDPQCAVMELDLDLKPDALDHVGAFLMVLSKYDSRVNTDHPVFRYLGESSERGVPAEVTFTISMRRRKPKPEGGTTTWKTWRKRPMLRGGK